MAFTTSEHVELIKRLIKDSLSYEDKTIHTNYLKYELKARSLNLGRQAGNTSATLIALQEFKSKYSCVVLQHKSTGDNLYLSYITQPERERLLYGIEFININSLNTKLPNIVAKGKPIIICIDVNFNNPENLTSILYHIDYIAAIFKSVF